MSQPQPRVDVTPAGPAPTPRPDTLPLPPGPGPLSRLRYLLRFRFGGDKDLIINELLDRYGPVVRISPFILMSGPEANRLLVASGPEHVLTWPNEDFPTLASMDGEQQVRHRKRVMEAFQNKRFAGYIPVMRELTERRAASWGPRIDLFEEMKQLALEVLLRNMLGLEPGSARAAAFLEDYWPLIHRADPTWVPWLQARRVRRAKVRMWALLRELIAERREAPGDDALSALVAAGEGGSGERLGEDELVRYAYMLMDFGHGDLAIFLTYALALMAVRPDLLEALRAEHAGYADDAPLALERRLPFTLSFLRELERRYPPVTEVHRLTAADVAFAGYRLPKDTYLVSAVQRTHLSPELFAQPLAFDPSRFAPPREEHKVPHALLGFGGGRHMCVAAIYSRIVTCVVLHTLLPRLQPRKEGGQQLPELDYGNVLQRPREPIFLELQR